MCTCVPVCELPGVVLCSLFVHWLTSVHDVKLLVQYVGMRPVGKLVVLRGVGQWYVSCVREGLLLYMMTLPW